MLRRLCPSSVTVAIIYAALFAGTAPAEAQKYSALSRSDLRTLQNSFADLADEVLPAVVVVKGYPVTPRDGDFRRMPPHSQGGGVIFRSNGYILTNYHVIEGESAVRVVLNSGAEHDAVVIQADERSDLAVLKIDSGDLPAARLGDLAKVRVGHWSIAIGNPFGLANDDGKSWFTVGNVSSIGRNLSQRLDGSGTRYYGNLIETSAPINPGNSGGPLVNLDGEVIGIVTAIETASGYNEHVGFAIPITTRTRRIVDSLTRGEEVRYGFLGVQIDADAAVGRYEVGGRTISGARITRVDPSGGPAARAGLRHDDVITEFDGTAIESGDHLVRVVGATPVGARVNVRFFRSRNHRATQVVLADRRLAMYDDSDDDSIKTFNWRGAVLAEVPDAVKREYGLNPAEVGLIVNTVYPAYDAAKRGMTEGQNVIAVNGRPVRTLEDFRKASAVASDAVRVGLYDERVIEFPLH